MIGQLQQLARLCIGEDGAQAVESIPRDFTPACPAEVLDVAASFCARAVPMMAERNDGGVAFQGASALLRFVADLPDDIRYGIEALSMFHDDIERAWDEPLADVYVCLCNTVQDVWAHALGPERREDAAIERELLTQRPATVLDFGAGAGHFAMVLAAMGSEVDIVELDTVKLSFCQYRAACHGLSDKIRVGLRPHAYDAALAINVLDHIQQPADVIGQLAARIRPGGRLYAWAQFPDDGWHNSGEDVVRKCGAALWKAFQPVPAMTPAASWLDVFERRAGATPAVNRLTRPVLHPRAAWRMDGDGRGTILGATSFYTGYCLLDEESRRLATTLDGTRSLSQIADETGVDLDELESLCHLLETQCLIHFDDARSEDVHAS